jgi:hypothetical protein
MEFCCKDMKIKVEQKCDIHEDVFECPDNVVYYNQTFDEYGLIIHDGGSSYIHILFCPFCGAKLPKSKRELYFNVLKKLKFHPFDENLPEEFKTDEWWKKRGL